KKLVGIFRGDVETTWGEEEVVVPTNTDYVKYTDEYKSRAIVQFDIGLITVETLDPTNSAQSLENAIYTMLLTPDDPRAVELYTAQDVTLSGKPYLHGLVVDQNKRIIDKPSIARPFAQYLAKNKAQMRTVTTKNGTEQVHFVQIKMVSDFQNRQARNYKMDVDKYATKYNVSKSLVYAIIKTESAFNPFAVSHVPAYGLMQIVPSTAGVDAHEFIKGTKKEPTKEYLFKSNQNIEFGTVYLHIVNTRYLKKITDPVKREYATISAYNGGAGNVFKTFSGTTSPSKAIPQINSLSTAEVLRMLKTNHPHAETRNYIVKVLEARKQFVNL
ncbi:MAG: murein transglycosylase domain-containing protein, partial [Ghiorsea sp.]|nr:murein transglycosylase domain-containing protein [Ghiorsea sp.]